MTTETYPIGTLVLSIEGEFDSDEFDQDRATGPRAWGWIADYAPECGYSLYFPNGTTVYIEQWQIDNAKFYVVVTPEIMASRLNELQRHGAAIGAADHVPDGYDYATTISILGVAP